MLKPYLILLLLAGPVLSQDVCGCGNRGCKCAGDGIDTKVLGFRTDLLDYNFTMNHITKLGENSFNSLVKVQYLVLQWNRIKKIASRTFAHNHDLRRLDLSNNLLTSLPSSVFRNNSKLSEIYLEYNNLTSIDAKVFHGLKLLSHLRLYNNQLQTIDPKAFLTNHLLFELYLDNNQLETAHWTWISHFNHASSSYELYFDGNPWSCDCRMKKFHQAILAHNWLKGENISVPKCTNLPNKPPITQVAETAMTCQAPKMTSHNNCSDDCHVIYDEGSSGTIFCSGTGKPLPRVNITDISGRVLTETKKGEVNLTFNPVMLEEAGSYICNVAGYNNKGGLVTLQSTIHIMVKPRPSAAVGVILAILFVVFLAAGIAACHYRRRKSRAGYGSLRNDPVSDHQLDEVPTPSQPGNVVYLGDDVDEQEDYVRDDYVRNDEKEVLV